MVKGIKFVVSTIVTYSRFEFIGMCDLKSG